MKKDTKVGGKDTKVGGKDTRVGGATYEAEIENHYF